MNYHIMIQDKFIDGYIKDVYNLNEQANNTFWIRSEKESAHYLKTTYPVEFIGNSNDSIRDNLSKIKQNDVLIIHWYDNKIAELVYDLPNKIVVIFWGGELYEDPFWYHFNWLYDKDTKAYVKKQYTPKLLIRKNIIKLSKNIFQILKYKFKVPDDIYLYEKKLKYLQRVDYLTITEKNHAEIDLLRVLYPGTKFKVVPSFYDVNFNIAINYPLNKIEGRVKLLLGNSATETNNHLEAFKLLKDLDVDIYCPLSYGMEDYKNFIITKGKSLFGERFFPITEYMDRVKYVEFLTTLDVVLMYHNRSQAWGNIATCLTLGKPVFIKQKNPLSKFINAMDLNYYDADKIKEYDLKALIAKEYLKRSDNCALLQFHLSQDKRLNDMKQLFNILK
jgi:dTDP-N-acetylfucosamine:lipid II N-acetylfucosaminyltransferase